MRRSEGENAAEDLRQSLAAGWPASDDAFDRIYPISVRKLLSTYASPVAACRRAAAFLAGGSAEQAILDVGSGAGKFCLIGALTTTASYSGLDARPFLVDAATNATGALRASRTGFTTGHLFALDWRCFNGLYLDEPFSALIDSSLRSAPTLPASVWDYDKAVEEANKILGDMPLQTRVATYGEACVEFPEGYELIEEERIGEKPLRLWLRVAAW